jgi:hypothetical protein
MLAREIVSSDSMCRRAGLPRGDQTLHADGAHPGARFVPPGFEPKHFFSPTLLRRQAAYGPQPVCSDRSDSVRAAVNSAKVAIADFWMKRPGADEPTGIRLDVPPGAWRHAARRRRTACAHACRRRMRVCSTSLGRPRRTRPLRGYPESAIQQPEARQQTSLLQAHGLRLRSSSSLCLRGGGSTMGRRSLQL